VYLCTAVLQGMVANSVQFTLQLGLSLLNYSLDKFCIHNLGV